MPSLIEIKKVRKIRKIKNRKFGIILICTGIAILSLSFGLKLPDRYNQFAVGIPMVTILFGLYTLLTGKALKNPTGTVFDGQWSAPRELKNLNDDIPYIVCKSCGKQLLAEMKFKNCPSCKAPIMESDYSTLKYCTPRLEEEIKKENGIKKCPRCMLINPPSTIRCDCGYDFEKKSIEKSYIDQKANK
ncbi:MAG: hypothetical protein MUQ00_10160 [Candidatus Aminicenantes bacterium]|nr:hypothetical protein [Candidatus Aminicenantes bacterium]